MPKSPLHRESRGTFLVVLTAFVGLLTSCESPPRDARPIVIAPDASPEALVAEIDHHALYPDVFGTANAPGAPPLTGPLSGRSALDSREYKVMLDARRFDGEDPTEAIHTLEAELVGMFALATDNLESSGDLATLHRERRVRFFDTPGSCALRQRGFAFRERVEEDAREATVKYRSRDRYVAASHDLESSIDGAESKFEEDVKAGYVSVFSRSTTAPLGDSPGPSRIADLLSICPAVAWEGLDREMGLEAVGDLDIEERVFGRRLFELGELEAEMSLTLWYLDGSSPAVAELSFKYEAKEDDFVPEAVARGMALFEVMQAMDGWVAPEAMTKTAWVYDRAGAFCD